jgi:hypothetical protein
MISPEQKTGNILSCIWPGKLTNSALFVSGLDSGTDRYGLLKYAQLDAQIIPQELKIS